MQLGSGSGFFLHKDLTAKLYSHQKEGVLWLWRLHKRNKGGILGDDMGSVVKVPGVLFGSFQDPPSPHPPPGGWGILSSFSPLSGISGLSV